MAEIKHIEEFEFYYSLGSARSYKKVSEEFGKGLRTVENWGKVEEWQKEVKSRDLILLSENRRNSLIGRRKKVTEYKQIVEKSISVYLQGLKDNAVEVKSVKELEMLIKLQCYLDDFILGAEEKLLNEPMGVEEQSACATSNTDTAETKDVLQQIELSLAALGGEESG